jgi:hypothetical protein
MSKYRNDANSVGEWPALRKLLEGKDIVSSGATRLPCGPSLTRETNLSARFAVTADIGNPAQAKTQRAKVVPAKNEQISQSLV